jgi:hypothetical protein
VYPILSVYAFNLLTLTFLSATVSSGGAYDEIDDVSDDPASPSVAGVSKLSSNS